MSSGDFKAMLVHIPWWDAIVFHIFNRLTMKGEYKKPLNKNQ